MWRKTRGHVPRVLRVLWGAKCVGPDLVERLAVARSNYYINQRRTHEMTGTLESGSSLVVLTRTRAAENRYKSNRPTLAAGYSGHWQSPLSNKLRKQYIAVRIHREYTQR